MGLKNSLSRVLDGLGVVDAMSRLRTRLPSPWLMSLCYHRTAETSQRGDLDGAVIDATPAQFEQQIAMLAQISTFVGIDDVIGYLHRGKKLPKNPVLISFDDGYKDCLTTSLPILQRFGAKAAFFLPTDFITERTMFWWDRIAWAVKRTSLERAELRYPRRIELSFVDDAGRSAAVFTLNEVVKKTRAMDLPRFLAGLDETLEVHMPREEERRMVDEVLMTWEDAKLLADAGMDIGSHTRTHRVLQTLEWEHHDGELSGSRRILEERLGKQVRSIAYPVGYSLEDRGDLRRAVFAAGYEIGFSCRSGVLGPTVPLARAGHDPYDLPRFLMDPSFDVGRLQSIAVLPLLAPTSRIDLGAGG